VLVLCEFVVKTVELRQICHWFVCFQYYTSFTVTEYIFSHFWLPIYKSMYGKFMRHTTNSWVHMCNE